MITAQDLPAGTVLPIVLSSALDAKKSKPGQKIEGKTMQEIRLPSGATIKSGSRVSGSIFEVTRPGAGGSRIALKFEHLVNDGRVVPLSVSLRAMAATADVYSAGVPIGTASEHESQGNWRTRQVGGDIVNRGQGVVAEGDAIVGKYAGAVWAKLTPAPEAGCPATDDNDYEQAMWVFSTSACGVYGLGDVKFVHAGRTAPLGQIVLESKGDLKVSGGSGWLLLVNAAPSGAEIKHQRRPVTSKGRMQRTRFVFARSSSQRIIGITCAIQHWK